MTKTKPKTKMKTNQRADEPEFERWLRRKNTHKIIRTIAQCLFFAALTVFLVVYLLLPKRYQPVTASSYGTGDLDGYSDTYDDVYDDASRQSRFITISYSGLTKSDNMESTIVSQNSFREQMEALKACGYVTISQEDIVNYYLYHGELPEKSLFLIFEDGILNTTTLAQQVLEDCNYRATMCTYATNLSDANSKFITSADLKKLIANSYWEMGTNGYRLSYINIFDRYDNYYGHLNTNEYVKIHEYLKRDYNHYLMDFLRDEDRLRQESVAQMEERIQYDYDEMRAIYTAELGSVPGLYILMHSNTNAFGTDPLVSAENRDNLMRTFAMNFNRQGTCLNTLDSSVYDLSRLQPQSYFSTNHLLMRIWDDVGGDMTFVVGDEDEAKNWYVDEGVAEFKNDHIILTSMPYGEGRMALSTLLLADLDMTVTLQGNLVGCQSVYLRTDRNLEGGIQVAFEDNELVIRELSDGENELFRKDMFTFDGGPFISEQEDEHNGLVELQKAIIEFDTDPERVAEAAEMLAKLETSPYLMLDEGGTPFVPTIDVTDRGNRKLRIRLNGSRLSVWVDDTPVVERLQVDTTRRGLVAFGAGVWKEEEFSQRNLYDDVYDAVFVSPVIHDINNEKQVYYSYTYNETQTVNAFLSNAYNNIINFFSDHF